MFDLSGARRIALLGGIYSNYLALQRALQVAKDRGVDAIYALGDLGAFGPHPDRAVEILREAEVPAIQGNYEESLSSEAEDCHCGYTDPRDNHFAQISYDYTRAYTRAEYRQWMGTLPKQKRLTFGGQSLLLCHGSPRRINEFLWASNTSAPFIQRLLREHQTDLIVCTHTGLHWERRDAQGRGVVNVGALGRPANNGQPQVWFTILEATPAGIATEFVAIDYDHHRLAAEMRAERLPEPFVQTILTGWWTTCLEILPAKERGLGRF